jgi:hypothetical protein
MDHSKYIEAGKDALAHVRSKVRYRGLNTAGGWIRNPAEVAGKFAARIHSKWLGAQRSEAYGGKFDAELYIRQMSKLAIDSNTGNCSELSALAFMRLAAKQVGPLEYWGVVRGSWDHAFVILNRDESIPIEKFADWSYSAVVVDPLYDRVADAGNLARWYPKMFPVKTTDMWLRLAD